MSRISRRDFFRLTTSTFAGLALSPFLSGLGSFEDAEQVRVATQSVSIYSEPNDQSLIVGQRFRDELVNVYREVDAGTPAYNPIWYRVWGGYMHRGRLQKVKTLFNEPLTTIPEGTRQLAELTVPYTPAVLAFTLGPVGLFGVRGRSSRDHCTRSSFTNRGEKIDVN